jgi:hypothetical protein
MMQYWQSGAKVYKQKLVHGKAAYAISYVENVAKAVQNTRKNS